MVLAGLAANGRWVVGYRVSSRSFPNREAVRLENAVRIVPKQGSAEAVSDNPYIAYECLLWNEDYVVAGNGSHTRVLFDRLLGGGPLRDIAATVLLAMDREFDQNDTPRIATILHRPSATLLMASVTARSLSVVPWQAKPGLVGYLATNGYAVPNPSSTLAIPARGAAAALCRQMISGPGFADFEHPVCAAAAIIDANSALDVAVLNVAA